MERKGAGPSQLPASISSVGSSGVLDLSCTYDITDQILQQESPCELQEDSLSPLVPPVSSLPFLGNAGSEPTSSASDPQMGDASSTSHLINYESPSENNPTFTDNAEIRMSLDAFYELGNRQEFRRSNKLPNTTFHQLSMKISELQACGNLYALRCLQLAKVIVNQDEIDLLQNKAQDAVFSSPACNETAADNKSIPGLSEDVRRYIVNHNKK